MYDSLVALRRLRGLICWVSKKYGITGHPTLSPPDLESEGYLTLMKCCKSFPEGQLRFTRFFKVSLYNRIKYLMTNERRLKRQYVKVELLEALGIPDTRSALIEQLSEKIDSLRLVLSKPSFKFLQQLSEPSEEVVEYAYREFCRRNKIHSQGISCRGYKQFRITSKHIGSVLGYSDSDCRLALKEIRSVYLQKSTMAREMKWQRIPAAQSLRNLKSPSLNPNQSRKTLQLPQLQAANPRKSKRRAVQVAVAALPHRQPPPKRVTI